MRKKQIGSILEDFIPIIVVGSFIFLLCLLIFSRIRSEQKRTTFFEIKSAPQQVLPIPLFYKRFHVGNIESSQLTKDGRIILKSVIRENVEYRFTVGDCIIPHGNTVILSKIMESNELLTYQDTTRCY